MSYVAVPHALKDLRQWVNWREEDRGGKLTKVPVVYGPLGNTAHASTTDPSTWRSFDEVSREGQKIGFVFAKDGGLVGIDLDHCVTDSEIAPWAQEILKHFPGAYVEFSPSGTGLHIICRGTLPKGGRRTAYEGGVIEIYNQGRYFTVTGNSLYPCETIAECQDGIDHLLQQYLRASRIPAVSEAPEEADFQLDPQANPPYKKLNLIKAANAQWEVTWTRKKRMPNDSSPSGYEQSLANMMATYEWSPQEICDTLVAWRREHDLPPKHYAALAVTISKAIEAADRNRALDDLSHADTTTPDQAHSIITHLTGLDVVRYVQSGKHPGHYRVYVGDDVVNLGPPSKARMQATWQDAAQDMGGHPFEALTKIQWQQFLVCLGRMVEREDVDESAFVSQFRAILQAYAPQATRNLTYSLVLGGFPFIDDQDQLHLTHEHLSGWLRTQRLGLTHGELLSNLQVLGAESHQVLRRSGHGKVAHRRYWKVPPMENLDTSPRMYDEDSPGDSQY